VAGQKLVLIDPRDYQARLDQAKEQLTNAAAQLAQANAQVAVRQADLDQAEANVRVAQAEQVQAQKDYGRYTSINPHAITQLQIDSSTASLRSANAKLDAANQAVGGAHAQLLTARAQVTAADASEQQARANVDAATLQLSYCTIVAPVSGRITHRTVNVGDYVNPGQAMFALVQDQMWVTANFKETQLDLMRPGQPVELEIDAFPDASFHGHVDSFQAGTGSAFSVLPAENATGNYVKVVQRVPVKILFDGEGPNRRLLAPGMSVVPTVTVR
jgi:membrane fusion protein (multidrug efflux system)